LPQPTDKQTYIGRFAPSPTGPLHLGSLYTALAGFLDARSHQGKWLLRIDDLDKPRNVEGAADSILKTLEIFGLAWDDSVAYQSQSLDVYNGILDRLTAKQLSYPCVCSRKTLAAVHAEASLSDVYPGLCRDRMISPDVPYALRIKTDTGIISFRDRLQGLVSDNLAEQHGDFVIKRKDGIIAYQFAVVIDDHLQQVNQVVRGVDLLESTPKQIYLQQILGLATPEYMHVPIIVDRQGYKLSKQTLATAVDIKNPQSVIFELLVLLQQNPLHELAKASLTELLAWAIAHWNPASLKNLRAIRQKIY
jgi:glutamyl-Q tRNA(Asp) synthetase